MANDRSRGNREAKKPKQPKKTVVPVAPLGGTSSKAGSGPSEVKKK